MNKHTNTAHTSSVCTLQPAVSMITAARVFLFIGTLLFTNLFMPMSTFAEISQQYNMPSKKMTIQKVTTKQSKKSIKKRSTRITSTTAIKKSKQSKKKFPSVSAIDTSFTERDQKIVDTLELVATEIETAFLSSEKGYVGTKTTSCYGGGLFTRKSVAQGIRKLSPLSGGIKPTCYADGKGQYVVAARLPHKTKRTWCIDSTGFSGEGIPKYIKNKWMVCHKA
jgi:hypothetical protein